jgi:hypothetical protein
LVPGETLLFYDLAREDGSHVDPRKAFLLLARPEDCFYSKVALQPDLQVVLAGEEGKVELVYQILLERLGVCRTEVIEPTEVYKLLADVGTEPLPDSDDRQTDALDSKLLDDLLLSHEAVVLHVCQHKHPPVPCSHCLPKQSVVSQH